MSKALTPPGGGDHLRTGEQRLKPIIKILGCIFYILTLGLFALVVNALLLLLVNGISGLLDLPLHVDGFWSAFWGAIIVGVVGWLINLVIPDPKPDSRDYDARPYTQS